jgi:hypothetical protein
MPGQVTHFYLAARLARQFGPFKGKDIRGEIYDGFDRWLKLNKQFKTAVAAIIAAEAADSTHSENANKMQKILNTYRKDILDSDNLAVFSAFAAGAVGPDLWTIPHSGTASLVWHKNIEGGWFFDLGHYNLSHIFPKYALKQICKKTDSLQKRYEAAYILGYISHICLDIVAHLNVNVFAGAYHSQQQEQWEPEQGNIKEKINKFNNHNKVEHYLDAYIRFFCFEGCHVEGSTGYKQVVKKDFGQNEDWDFPNYTDYYSKKLKFGWIEKTDGITNEDSHFLDLTTSLPGPFAHRYHVSGSKGVTPFVRDYYWDAYTNKADWMDRKQDGLVDTWIKSGRQSLNSVPSEQLKLEFFNFVDDLGWRDINDEITTQYYYLNTLIPNLSKVKKHYANFFSPSDFGHFLQGARNIASAFIGNAVKYLADKKDSHLSCLDHWNLDTGLAYRIKAGTDTETYCVPVCLEVISVLDIPELSGWQISPITKTPVSANKIWPIPVAKKEEKKEEKKKDIRTSTGKKYTFMPSRAIGIEIQVTQTCFYDDDYGEISAFIYGDSEKKEKPWVKGESAGNDDKTTEAYKITTCIEDFKTKYAKVMDKKSAGRDSRLYKTVFIGHIGKSNEKKTDAIKIHSSVKARALQRHVKLTTCRKYVNHVTETGNFYPNKLVKYQTVFPSEDMVFSLFALFKRDGKYEDIFHEVTFQEAQLKELKKIKIIGLNIILLILKLDKNKKVVVDEAWIDGERQNI